MPSIDQTDARLTGPIEARLRRYERELAALCRITKALFGPLTSEEMIRRGLETALALVGVESGALLLADTTMRSLVIRHSIGPNQAPPGTTMPWDTGIAGEAFQSGFVRLFSRPCVNVNHAAATERVYSCQGMHELMMVPLKGSQGCSIGVIEIHGTGGRTLNEEDAAILLIVSGFIAAAIEEAISSREETKPKPARLAEAMCRQLRQLLTSIGDARVRLGSKLKAIASFVILSSAK
jgi:GAF domain-containing protein